MSISEPRRVAVEDEDGRRGYVLELADPLHSQGSLHGLRYTLLDGTPLELREGALQVPASGKRLHLRRESDSP